MNSTHRKILAIDIQPGNTVMYQVAEGVFMYIMHENRYRLMLQSKVKQEIEN